MPTVNLTLEELDVLRSTSARALARVTQLEAKLIDTLRRGVSPEPALVVLMLDAVLPVVQYAVANLPPETAPGWPYEALRAFGQFLKDMPGHEPLAADLSARAAEIEPYERERATRPKHVVRATAADFGPQTGPARVLHDRTHRVDAGVVVEDEDEDRTPIMRPGQERG